MYHKIGLITDYNNSIENDKEPSKLLTNKIIMAGCNYKSNIQVGDVIPLEVTPSQSNRPIVWSGTSAQVCDHDYDGVANIVPSVIHNMNQSINTGDSLYSGGSDGTGRHFVSLIWCNIWSIFGL